MSTSALVLFSGGQDSTTCLAWALSRYDRVETVAFDYGQRHAIELECRMTILDQIRVQFPNWAMRLGEDHMLDLKVLGDISETSLTRETEIHFSDEGLPNTFVPARNLVFLTFAAAIAYRRGISKLVGGMCETDFSGYPDCRDATMKAMENALSLGLDRTTEIETPLMWIDKARTWALARELGGDPLVGIIIEHSHTCYLGERGTQQEWGKGCGECPACQLRREGYDAWVKGAAA